jgi:hypothetical protein
MFLGLHPIEDTFILEFRNLFDIFPKFEAFHV